MKKLWLSLLLIGISLGAYPQSQGFTLGNFSFFLSPKILKEGSIIEAGLGFQYTQRWGGEIRFRNTMIAENEPIADVADSLNAVNENLFEIFFLPAEYFLYQRPNSRLWLGAGAYYEYDKLNEKGFFNMPALENMGRERVNSYTNDFSMHLIGPLIDLGFRHKVDFFETDWLNIGALGVDLTLSGGIVPVFFLTSSQKMSMVPLLDPHYAQYNQTTAGSPYLYLSLNMTLFRFINLTLLYDYARLKYKNIDFDDHLQWITPERTVITQSFKIEASLLIPLGSMQVQIGGGCTFDSTRFDTGSPVENNRPYFILTAKKSGT
jgi:hypothetical protein